VRSGRSARNHLLAPAHTNLRSPIDEFAQGNASAEEGASLTDFADKPLVVLTAGIGSAPDHLAAQNHFATLSTNSAHRTIDSANHQALIADGQGRRHHSSDPRRGSRPQDRTRPSSDTGS
jgi:hypothetical protein